MVPEYVNLVKLPKYNNVNNRKYLKLGELEVQDQGSDPFSFQWDLSSWHIDDHLAVSSYGLFSVLAQRERERMR